MLKAFFDPDLYQQPRKENMDDKRYGKKYKGRPGANIRYEKIY